jgi:membrane peptidoglycan carboxypeptidase
LFYINKIKYQDGSEQTFENKGKKAMEPYTAYMITDMGVYPVNITSGEIDP